MKRERETPEVAAGVRRMVSALGRRVGRGDPADLCELVALRDTVDDAVREAVRMQHQGQGGAEGFSWGEIALGMGTSKQAVQQRYGA